uniref:Ankyrin repeat protein n=1 Tax=Marseillevirus LCMAC201 TaxID=2506605 RepID=A0A481YVK8_9VIRU|nr:MAG: ankyrin repeat protein [Marseillevirus LCMAC201]
MNIELAITDLTSFPKQDLITLAKYYNLSLAPTRRGDKYQLARRIAAQLYAKRSLRKELIRSSGEQLALSHKIGYMPNNGDLIQGVKSNNLELVKNIISPENINLRNEHGYTALMFAKSFDMAKLLVDNGAQVNLQNEYGSTALMFAAHNNGNTPIVELLLNKGAQVDIQSTDGWTALALAAYKGYAPIVELLLNKNANVNIQTIDGWTALMMASQKGNTPIVELLLNKNAQVDIQDENGLTALIFATQNGNTPIVELLIEKGANLDLQDKDGITALLLAVDQNNFDVVKLLIEKSANLDLQHKDGITALDLAKKKNLPLIIKLLQPKKPFDPSWYQSCSDDLDIISQESWTDLANEQEPDDPVTIRFSVDPGQPERVECGARDNFIQMWKTAPTMVPWIPNPEAVEHRLLSGEPLVDNSGRGAIPASGPKFWKITPYHYVMNPELLEEDGSNYIADKLSDEKIRYGNVKGTFGESEAHGQHSTYIYKLKREFEEEEPDEPEEEIESADEESYIYI